MGNTCCGSRAGMSEVTGQPGDAKVDLQPLAADDEKAKSQEQQPKATEEDVDEKEKSEKAEAPKDAPKAEAEEEEPPQVADNKSEVDEGSSSQKSFDTDASEIDDDMLKIGGKVQFFNKRKELAKFLKKCLKKSDDKFERIDCSGSSYDESSCAYIAEVIAERSSDDFWYADFSNMFVTRDKTKLPQSLKLLIDAVADKPLKELYLHDNAFGPIGVQQFEPFLRSTKTLQVLSVSNCGLGPQASTVIAEALLANEDIKLTKLMISRSRVETEGAIALAKYFQSYDSLEHLEIFQNGIRDDGSTQLAASLRKHSDLKHLEINDNFFNTEESFGELLCLIKDASALKHLNIDSSSIEEESLIEQLKLALPEFACKDKLKSFNWSYDAFEMNDVVKELLEILKDFPKLKDISLVETVMGPKRRNKLRKAFKKDGIKLWLSDREKNDADEGSESEKDSDDDGSEDSNSD